jgi:hypothetical protein
MRKSLVVLALVGMVLLICSSSFAATSYVVTNDDNCVNASNTSSIYTLNTTTGALTLFKTLTTGGLGNCGGFFGGVQAGVTQSGSCLYIVDGGTSDIAGFKVSTLAKVGNYSNPAVNDAFPGGSIALTPNGKYLYVTYGGSENIGAWKVNSDCSLTFINAYQASFGVDTYSGIVVDPTGKGLVVSVTDLGGLEVFAINASTGALTDLGSTNLDSLSGCANLGGCFPTGLDISKKEQLFVGNASGTANGLSAQMTASTPYFTHVTFIDLTNSEGLFNVESPWLGATAYNTGAGALYFGASGGASEPGPGVLTTALSASGVTLGAVTPINNSPFLYDGVIRSTGTWMVVSEWFDQLQVFTINANGSLTATSQGPVVDANADGALSFFIYPNTR